jgi:hypothetical protein
MVFEPRIFIQILTRFLPTTHYSKYLQHCHDHRANNSAPITIRLFDYHLLTSLASLSMILVETVALPGPNSRSHTPTHCDTTYENSNQLGYCQGDPHSESIDSLNGNIFGVGGCQRACHCEIDSKKPLWMVCAESVVPFCTAKQLLEACGCTDKTNLGGKCWGPCRCLRGVL